VVIPVYVYRNMQLHDVVIFGELLAVAVIIMCLLFVTVDLDAPTGSCTFSGVSTSPCRCSRGT